VNFRELEQVVEASGWRGLARGAMMGTLLGTATLGGASLVKPPNEKVSQIQHTVPQDSFRNFISATHPNDELGPEPHLAEPIQQADPEIEHYRHYISQSEGFRNRVYNDGRGNLTIGVGHLLRKQDAVLFKHLFGNSVSYDAIRSGRQNLTDNQVGVLFEYDLNNHLQRAKRVFPSFNGYPLYVRIALTDSVFRGDMSPKTAKYINAGQWEKAAKEYLNRVDYRNRKKLGIPGIGPRMERNQSAMLKYANELRSGRHG
jgi:GH24 family phage-related lysozyme (muramidase)